MSDNRIDNDFVDDLQLDLYLENDVELDFSIDSDVREISLKGELISWTKVIVFSIICAYILRTFVVINATVPTPSMENTISAGSQILATQVYCYVSEPKRLDILIFPFPDDEEIYFVKRVIGLPGEIITIRDGKVYVNDSKTPLLEPYLKETPAGDFGPFTVPKNSYFMLGDNRNNSEDSRYWKNTYVAKDKFIGKVYFTYSPEIKIVN